MKKIKTTGALALSQIFILIVGIIAISYAIGSEVGIVSARVPTLGDVCIKYLGGTGLNYGSYAPQTTSPTSEKLVNAKYYKNNKIGILWSQGDGAYYLAVDTNNKWYYWNPDKDVLNWRAYGVVSRETFRLKTEIAGTTCRELFEKEDTGEDPKGIVTIPADSTSTDKVLTKADHAMCDTKCFSEPGYTMGSCADLVETKPDPNPLFPGRQIPIKDPCNEGELYLGRAPCNLKGECCCYTTSKETEEEEAEILEEVKIECQDWKEGGYDSFDECVKDKLKDKDPLKEKTSPAEALTLAAAWTSLKGIALAVPIAIGVYKAVQGIGDVLGFDEETTSAAAVALGWGYFAGHATVSIFGKGGVLAGKFGKIGKFLGTGWGGVAVGGLVAIILFKKETQETITFTCQPWDADTGGKYCDECNKQGILPCSEYQCRSLGQACELVNPGTDEEKCVWVNRNDVEFPTIEAWDDALISTDYKYSPDNSISPPERGVRIEYIKSTDKCVPAFTPLAFGITTNEPAKCKLDILRKDSFDDMNFYFSGGLFKTEHSYSLSLPGGSALESEGITAENDGEYEIYTRCQDANGNFNTANFVFKFCVDEGPDTTPPLIVGTTPLNNQPIAFGQSSFDIEVYLNEPSDCSWSHLDQGYNDMTPMTNCKKSIVQNAQMLYSCEATLEGLKDRVENRFYFRCKDLSENVNAESYKFSLIGTQPLVIGSVAPNKTIKDSTDTIKVTLEATTSAGYKDGEATCWYKEADADEGDYIMFFETDSYQHSQELWLPKGNYDYSIKCIDLGGNSDTESVSFSVETDTNAPMVVRAYKEETYLKIITNEPAVCVYDVKDCGYTFEDGIKMTTMDDINHYTDWNTKTNFYVKCKDEYEKQPSPDECSIIIRPFEIY